MTTIGITGHTGLTEATLPLVAAELRKVLAPYADGGLTGVSCLARGADQIFAQTVLDLGGTLDVVIPAADYISGIRSVRSRVAVEKLLALARDVRWLPFETSGPVAYFAGSKVVIEQSELLLAVWDGGPADGKGGTADAAEYARHVGRNLRIVWPSGAARA